MPLISWSEADTARALEVWAEYRQRHEVAGLAGQTVGIDPAGGRLWFGESATDVVKARDAEGVDVLLYYLRVGRDYYLRKGGAPLITGEIEDGVPIITLEVADRPLPMIVDTGFNGDLRIAKTLPVAGGRTADRPGLDGPGRRAVH